MAKVNNDNVKSEKYVFINDAVNYMVVEYVKNRKKKYSKGYNSFLVCVFRMLCLIYDEKSLLKGYVTKNFDDFDTTLSKYGYSIDNINKFKALLLAYYRIEEGQKNRTIKKKNKYFNAIQKLLIDMMVTKNNNGNINLVELIEFYELLFTANSFDFYRKTFALASAYNPYEIDEYFQKFYAINSGE